MVDGVGLFSLGLIYGATVCSMTCLSYLGPYLLANGDGFRDGLLSSLFFGLGKICCYVFLGGLAGYLGRELISSSAQSWAMGLVLIGVALTMPLVARRSCRDKCRPGGKLVSLLTLGAATSLVPCPPVLAILTMAAGQGSMVTGMGFGLSYGLGIIISPLLLIGGGLALVSRKLRQEVIKFTPWLQGLAMTIMILLGVNIIYGGIK
ncbi:MAG: sulfite exporter TauE/SafE family protein [Proteobacteria bacterium]|nr:sulfite exporter TauE/SafE family protein [Pseudomonadota bacterium]MBU1717295.1 sulfite exporter TauE/SafE family protein [Pseudomonadota bacterium]